MKIAFFASGRGSNVKAILDQTDRGEIEPVCLVCDQEEAPVIDLAKVANLPIFVLSSSGRSRRDWEDQVLEYLSQFDIDYIVLAGFMRLLTEEFIDHYPKRILNIHPSLLPKYPGIHSIQEVYQAKESETGVSIFYVDEGMDTGDLIAQEKIKINSNWQLADLEEAVHKLEHQMYSQVLMDLKERMEND